MKIEMCPCPKCKSAEVGTELRCQATFIATKCYSCGYEGPTNLDRDKAKEEWNSHELSE